MSLTPEQKAAVSSWIVAGDNLSVVQKKLRDQFQVSMTYMDVRFLVDDLNLTLKDPAPKADASDVTKAKVPPAAPAKAPATAKPAPASVPADATDALADVPTDEAVAPEEDALPPAGGGVSVDVDGVTLIPGAIASGSVTFSDGVTGKWIVDQYGRPGFTEISQPGYRPSKDDAQAFMQQLDHALQQKGF